MFVKKENFSEMEYLCEKEVREKVISRYRCRIRLLCVENVAILCEPLCLFYSYALIVHVKRPGKYQEVFEPLGPDAETVAFLRVT